MTRYDHEIEELREKVHCAVVLERTPPCWKLDRKESTKGSLKYRRGKGEILIVTHAGRGWWDPTSDAKGDVFRPAQRAATALSGSFRPPALSADGKHGDSPANARKRFRTCPKLSPGSSF